MYQNAIYTAIVLIIFTLLFSGWLYAEIKNAKRWIRIGSGLVFTASIGAYFLLRLVGNSMVYVKGVYLHGDNVLRQIEVLEAGKGDEIIPLLDVYAENVVTDAYAAQFQFGDRLNELLWEVKKEAQDSPLIEK
ncbi:MAG: hypothetical protein O7G85_17715 [Planctomycetota bacterium]|nr:hypothetical protein [Planctomycetota bacterium]